MKEEKSGVSERDPPLTEPVRVGVLDTGASDVTGAAEVTGAAAVAG